MPPPFIDRSFAALVAESMSPDTTQAPAAADAPVAAKAAGCHAATCAHTYRRSASQQRQHHLSQLHLSICRPPCICWRWVCRRAAVAVRCAAGRRQFAAAVLRARADGMLSSRLDDAPQAHHLRSVAAMVAAERFDLPAVRLRSRWERTHVCATHWATHRCTRAAHNAGINRCGGCGSSLGCVAVLQARWRPARLSGAQQCRADPLMLVKEKKVTEYTHLVQSEIAQCVELLVRQGASLRALREWMQTTACPYNLRAAMRRVRHAFSDG